MSDLPSPEADRSLHPTTPPMTATAVFEAHRVTPHGSALAKLALGARRRAGGADPALMGA
jgi:hypothetical protein